MHQRTSRSATSRAIRGGVALATAGLVLVGGLPAAMADGDDRAYPSQSEVDDARDRVDSTQRSVDAIRADLASASAQLEGLAVEAAKAAEAYNGAQWRLEQARDTAKTAKRKAARQDQRLGRQRDQIGRLVADTYQGGGSLGQVGAYLTSEDPEVLLDRVAAYKGASESLASDYDKFAAQGALAKVFKDQATEAAKLADQAAKEAEQAKQAAAAAVAAQQSAVAQLADRRDGLMSELAEAQHVSVSLATQRQEALERIEAERRAREAERRAEAQRAAEWRAQQDAQDQRRAEWREAQRNAEERRRDRADRADDPEPEPRPRPEPEPDPDPPPQSRGAQAAIDFAYAQLGEPYVWGAEGPGSWDCSGLTMKAWEAAGKSLTHYSGAQYYETERVSYSQLRRGDLIFWSDDGTPDTIFHVALYIGDNQMIHAPRTGVPVKVENVFYWQTPDFYGRV
ncbi:MAG: NlpC/P60 family protein [Nocardioidaceae bacterium]